MRQPNTATTGAGSRRASLALWSMLVALGALVLFAVLPASAQEIRLRGLQGGELTESDVLSQDTIIVVWASWSPRCRDIVSRANGIAGRWGSSARVITLNYQEDRAAVESFLAGQNLRVPVYLDSDGEFSKKYSSPNLPVLLVFKGGKAVYKAALPDDPDAAISGALK